LHVLGDVFQCGSSENAGGLLILAVVPGSPEGYLWGWIQFQLHLTVKHLCLPVQLLRRLRNDVQLYRICLHTSYSISFITEILNGLWPRRAADSEIVKELYLHTFLLNFVQSIPRF